MARWPASTTSDLGPVYPGRLVGAGLFVFAVFSLFEGYYRRL